MKKNILFLFLATAIISNAIAQSDKIMYAAAKNGLSVFAEPDAKAKVLGKIPYGEKLPVEVFYGELNRADTLRENLSKEQELIYGADAAERWYKIKFKNETAYIFSAQLFPVPPPKSGIRTLKNYFKQLSVVTGKSEVKQPGVLTIDENTGEVRIKELYKNGMEIHKQSLYKQSSELYILPEFSMQQAFILIQPLQAYPQLIEEKEAFPLEDYTSADKLIKVKIDDPEGHVYVTEISIMKNYRETKLFKGLGISLLDNQALISFTENIDN